MLRGSLIFLLVVASDATDDCIVKDPNKWTLTHTLALNDLAFMGAFTLDLYSYKYRELCDDPALVKKCFNASKETCVDGCEWDSTYKACKVYSLIRRKKYLGAKVDSPYSIEADAKIVCNKLNTEDCSTNANCSAENFMGECAPSSTAEKEYQCSAGYKPLIDLVDKCKNVAVLENKAECEKLAPDCEVNKYQKCDVVDDAFAKAALGAEEGTKYLADREALKQKINEAGFKEAMYGTFITTCPPGDAKCEHMQKAMADCTKNAEVDDKEQEDKCTGDCVWNLGSGSYFKCVFDPRKLATKCQTIAGPPPQPAASPQSTTTQPKTKASGAAVRTTMMGTALSMLFFDIRQ